MTDKWVMWIPRPQTVADTKDSGKPSLTTKAEGWRQFVERKRKTDLEGQATEEGKYEFYLRYVDGLFPGEPSEGDVVYIFGGHGESGRDYVSWPGDTNKLYASDIADAFATRGWGTQFSGRVKIYSCYSGDGTKPFAKLVADAIRKKNYDKCTYFGYHGEITQQYEASVTTGIKSFRFKTVPVQHQGTHRWSMATGAIYSRLKTKRDPF